jgi:hypothetical protein
MERRKVAFVADVPLLRGNPAFLEKILIRRVTEYGKRIAELEEMTEKLRLLERQTIEERIGEIMPVDYIDVTAVDENDSSIQSRYTLNVKESIKKGECVVVLDRDVLDKSVLSAEELAKIHFLDITRDGGDGFVNRAGSEPLNEQFDRIANGIGAAEKIVFVDDVLFSGKTIICAKGELEERVERSGRVLRRGFGSIFALSLAEENGKSELEHKGIDSDVISERSGYSDLVDARDLCYGFKNSGRASPEGNRSYFLPFGDPECASVPKEKQLEFSRVCATYGKAFWEITEPSMTRFMYDRLEIGGGPYVQEGFTKNSRFLEILESACSELNAKIDLVSGMEK